MQRIKTDLPPRMNGKIAYIPWLIAGSKSHRPNYSGKPEYHIQYIREDKRK